jgi:alkylhydroperoxidase/carboxymuconolactone decarboxylase family protein YurZ
MVNSKSPREDEQDEKEDDKKRSSSNYRKRYVPARNLDLGDMLRTCGGWVIYKKTLPDNRIVYSAVKGKEVPPNKEDWNLIKGEVYTESGWKWGKWGKFEKWGSISNEEENLNKLCSVLEKYYLKTPKDEPKEEGYTQDELKEMIAQLNILANKGNKMAQKQARVLQFLIK